MKICPFYTDLGKGVLGFCRDGALVVSIMPLDKGDISKLQHNPLASGVVCVAWQDDLGVCLLLRDQQLGMPQT